MLQVVSLKNGFCGRHTRYSYAVENHYKTEIMVVFKEVSSIYKILFCRREEIALFARFFQMVALYDSDKYVELDWNEVLFVSFAHMFALFERAKYNIQEYGTD